MVAYRQTEPSQTDETSQEIVPRRHTSPDLSIQNRKAYRDEPRSRGSSDAILIRPTKSQVGFANRWLVQCRSSEHESMPRVSSTWQTLSRTQPKQGQFAGARVDGAQPHGHAQGLERRMTQRQKPPSTPSMAVRETTCVRPSGCVDESVNAVDSGHRVQQEVLQQGTGGMLDGKGDGFTVALW